MFKKETYINRRHQLRAKLKNGIALILGNADSPMNCLANTYKFRQDSNFLYFFGLDLPGFAGVIDLDEDKDYIFGNDVEIEDIIWTGQQTTVQENAALVGISLTSTLSQFSEFIKKLKTQGRTIHFLPPYRATNMLWLENLLGIPALQTKKHASIALCKAVIDLRSIKDAEEITEIDQACDTAYKIHTTAMRFTHPDICEHEIAGHIEGIAISAGGMLSYPTILSKHGETLHNHTHNNLLQNGDLLLIDAGCETSLHYASDITRTFPVSGKFSQKQREIYEIVLAANNDTVKSTKPGAKYLDIHFQAARIIASGLKDLGLMQGSLEDIVQQGAHALFFPHGLGHMVGLDVHDMEDLGEDYVGYDEETQRVNQFGAAYVRMGKRLQPGYVVTNEPGIYFIPELINQWQTEKKFATFINYEKVNTYRNFGGIRIEDDILITANGCRLLGKQRVPVTVKEIENIVGK